MLGLIMVGLVRSPCDHRVMGERNGARRVFAEKQLRGVLLSFFLSIVVYFYIFYIYILFEGVLIIGMGVRGVIHPLIHPHTHKCIHPGGTYRQKHRKGGGAWSGQVWSSSFLAFCYVFFGLL